MLGRATALKTADTAALESIAQQGAEEELPAKYKLAGEGMAPEACHFLLSHGTFLKKNNEGKPMLQACCFDKLDCACVSNHMLPPMACMTSGLHALKLLSVFFAIPTLSGVSFLHA